jgi:hypothetical protein
MGNLTGEQAQPEVGRFTAVARLRLEGDDVQGPDIQMAGDALVVPVTNPVTYHEPARL